MVLLGYWVSISEMEAGSLVVVVASWADARNGAKAKLGARMGCWSCGPVVSLC